MQGLKFTRQLRGMDARSRSQKIQDWQAYWDLKRTALSLVRVQRHRPTFVADDRALAQLQAYLKNFKLRQQTFDKPQYRCTISLERKDLQSTPLSYVFTQAPGESIVHHFQQAKRDFKAKIQTIRRNKRQLIMVQKGFVSRSPGSDGSSFNYRMVAGVHELPETVLNMMLVKQAARVFEYKAPKTPERHVGVEIEFYCKYDRKNLAAELLKANLIDNVRVMSDGSIRDYPSNYHPHEVTILAPEKDYVDIIARTCKVLKLVGAKVNASCGMHVHLDMRDRNKEIAFNNLVTAQPILFAMNPKTRSESTYCKINKSKIFNASTCDRYSGINGAAYSKHKTLEIRIHSGTVNDVKILNWVKLLLAIVSKDEAIKRGPRTFKTFIKSFNLDLEMATYIAHRIEKFHNNNNVDNDEAAVA